uniref:Integral membrane protein n=1 Tax=Parastrongyloides trichosuri TaxID=131310 RepID=A0A0N4Z3F2_PARTI
MFWRGVFGYLPANIVQGVVGADTGSCGDVQLAGSVHGPVLGRPVRRGADGRAFRQPVSRRPNYDRRLRARRRPHGVAVAHAGQLPPAAGGGPGGHSRALLPEAGAGAVPRSGRGRPRRRHRHLERGCRAGLRRRPGAAGDGGRGTAGGYAAGPAGRPSLHPSRRTARSPARAARSPAAEGLRRLWLSHRRRTGADRGAGLDGPLSAGAHRQPNAGRHVRLAGRSGRSRPRHGAGTRRARGSSSGSQRTGFHPGADRPARRRGRGPGRAAAGRVHDRRRPAHGRRLGHAVGGAGRLPVGHDDLLFRAGFHPGPPHRLAVAGHEHSGGQQHRP